MRKFCIINQREAQVFKKIPAKILILAAFISLTFPLIIGTVFSPRIDKIMISEASEEAIHLAEHFIHILDIKHAALTSELITPAFIMEANTLTSDFKLYKLSLLDSNGEVIFSTNEEDIGYIAHEKFFTDIVKRGEPYTLYQKKGEISLENVRLERDVVETYVPIMRDGAFLGSLEIYYDISFAVEEYSKLKKLIAFVLFIISFGSVISIAVISIRSEEAQRKKAEAENELMTEQLRSDALFTALGESIIIQDRDFKVVYQNPVNLKLFGDRRGEYCYKVYGKKDAVCDDCPAVLTLQDGLVHTAEHASPTKDSVRTFSLTSAPVKNPAGDIIATIKVVRDVSDQKKMEEQLRHSQKMQAIGTLVSGISHEFNNILCGIMGFSEMLLDSIPADDPRRAYVQHISSASNRAAQITRELLTYSRKQIVKMEDFSLNPFIQTLEPFLSRLIGTDIRLRLDLAKKDLVIHADAQQIEQVLLNLAANARDAMPEGGTLTISTTLVTLGDDFAKLHGFGEPGRYALMSVSDTGCGMDPATQAKIFEPFFTTKDVGRGTGLGLSTAYGVVKKHDGFITLKSMPGKGSTFLVYLPLVDFTVADRKNVP